MAVKKNIKKTVAPTDGSMMAFKSDVRFFKGMTIVLLTLLLVIFFTFSALFAAMYAQTKAADAALIEAYNSLIKAE